MVERTDPTLRRIPLQPVVRGTDPILRRIPLGSKYRVDTITDLERGKSDPLSYPLRRSRPVEHQGDPQEGSLVSVDMRGGVTQERYIPIPRWVGIRLVAAGTWQMDILIVVGMQQTGDRPIAACTQYLGDDLDTGAIYLSQRKTAKRQPTGIKLMAVGTRHVNFSLRAKTNSYLKRGQQMGKSLINANTQWIDFGLMAVSQQTTMPRVVAEQQTNTCPQVISAQ